MHKKIKSSLTPVSEGVLVKISTTISAEVFCFVLCVQEFLDAWKCQPTFHSLKKPQTFLLVNLIMVPLNSLLICYKTAKCGCYQNTETKKERRKARNSTILTAETGIITANLHNVGEDLAYVHSISSQGLPALNG